ncbi:MULTISPECIES: SGNH/GDSL hydrolase family protein [unclassified Lacrimispora]|uniref:SGNH/GDSL hydrolase family protein n=1 Tax=unclassified Lacrimispora TaxID=2719232 RepID=UPI00376FCC30
MKEYFKHGTKVLFYGDSITDASRDRENPLHMGYGYANKIADIYTSLYPNSGVQFYNRGIGGNRLSDLLDRYHEDVCPVKPDFVSVLVGINDTWRRYDRGLIVTEADFEKQYRDLLGRIRLDFLQSPIMVIEPFLLPTDPEKTVYWEDLTPKIEIVKSLAKEMADFYLPSGQLFDEAMKDGYSPFQLSEDGVHPTNTGHAYLAVKWLQMVGVL